MIKKDKKINWKRFSTHASKLLKCQSLNTKVTIKAEGWEEIIFVALSSMDYEVDWDPADHVKGTDLEIKGKNSNIYISAKAGKVTENTNTFSMSSYRLTRYETLKDKLKFLKENAQKLDVYLAAPRLETEKSIQYNILKIDPISLTPPKLLKPVNWVKNKNGWEFKTNNGLEASIRRKMSDQLWYKIPLNLKSIKLLSKVTIKRKDMGSNLFKALK